MLDKHYAGSSKGLQAAKDMSARVFESEPVILRQSETDIVRQGRCIRQVCRGSVIIKCTLNKNILLGQCLTCEAIYILDTV